MESVLLVSHGSRSPKTKEETDALVAELKKRTGITVFESAFLDIEHPTIPEGIDICVGAGATHVTILLNFLNSGRHVNEDIPEIVRLASAQYPSVRFTITSPVGQHPNIPDLFLDMIKHVKA